jgi:hypothetical protein
MAAWHNQLGLICLGSAALSALFAYLILRPFGRRQLVDRLPLFLVTGAVFLFIGLVALPHATPGLFEHYLGHSLSDMVTQRLRGAR